MTHLTLLGTLALKGVLAELEPFFSAQTEVGFTCVWGPTGTVYDSCRAGEAPDLLMAVPDAIEVMIGEGHAVPGSRVDVARTVIGVAVKAGAPRPQIATVEDLQAALRQAKSVTYTDPATQAPSGLHVARLLAEWGMTAEVDAKTRFGRGGPVGEFLVSGEAELALQQVCELMQVEGVDVVGPLPDKIQLFTTLSVALGSRSRNPRAAQTLITSLSSTAVFPVLRRHGLFTLLDP